MKKPPSMNYLFLPFDTSQHQPKFNINDPIRICHSPTDRYYKGSDTIIPVCENLAKNGKIEFILIENVPHNKTQQLKQSCDILIDQVHNRGGWGYGMNSIEALSMGLCCLTEVIPKYEKFIPDHPFININEANIEAIREGLELTLKSFEVSLETAGIIPINPKQEAFDPEKHEAISVVEDNKKDPNTIIKVIQRGFTIQDRILRPAKVIVTKKTDKK